MGVEGQEKMEDRCWPSGLFWQENCTWDEVKKQKLGGKKGQGGTKAGLGDHGSVLCRG
jgi:hypothetical protein